MTALTPGQGQDELRVQLGRRDTERAMHLATVASHRQRHPGRTGRPGELIDDPSLATEEHRAGRCHLHAVEVLRVATRQRTAAEHAGRQHVERAPIRAGEHAAIGGHPGPGVSDRNAWTRAECWDSRVHRTRGQPASSRGRGHRFARRRPLTAC